MGCKHLRLIVAALLLGTFAIATTARAQIGTGTATQYTIQVTQIALCASSTCGSPVMLGNTSQSFDIASAAVGGALGSFASTSGLPVGTTFTHLQTTMSRTISIDGTVTDGANLAGITNTACRTDTANDGGAAGAAATAGDGAEGAGTSSAQDLFVPTPLSFGGGTLPTTASYTNEGIGLPLGASTMTYMVALSSPFTTTSEEPSINIAFNTQSALGTFNGGANNCKMVPQPPVVTISIE